MTKHVSLTRWQTAVVKAIHRYAARHGTRLVKRRALVSEELKQVVADAAASGATPAQTLSRVLQELRRAGILEYVGRGTDLLLDQPIAVETEDLPDSALDAAITAEQLRISDVPTGEAKVLARRRRGQERLRERTLRNYKCRCALCDVMEPSLLVASHIVRWSDDTDAQGRLSNVICLCRMHDALFETGFIALTDDLSVLHREGSGSATVRFLQQTARKLRLPTAYPPSSEYLRRHRERTGHGKRT